MPQFPYQFFEEYVVRTPFFSNKDFQKKFEKEKLSDDDLKEVCKDPVFQEAIYLASPYVYQEVQQWFSGKELQSKQIQKLKNTILKYYSRMSTRCTPFGLFSQVGLGRFNHTQSSAGAAKIIRDTKLDMHFLVNLARSFERIPHIKEQLLFFPNNSIYKIGDKIRYVEFENNNGKRDYIISSAVYSNELEKCLKFSKSGKTISELASIVISKEITINDAEEYMAELIDNQILVSEIEPVVSGNDFLDTLISALNRINAEKEVETLLLIKSKLDTVDGTIGNSIKQYLEIEQLIQSLNADYEKNYLFQTDLYNNVDHTLSPNWKKELKKGISFLSKLCLLQKDNHFEQFKKAFNERFETQEMPLTYVLDVEVGIGYRQDVQSKGIHPYLEDLKFPFSAKNEYQKIELSPVHKVLNEKLQQALWENQIMIELSDEDFKGFEENWKDIPETISFMGEIVSENKQEKLFLNGGGGSTAANLLGRFCSEKSKLKNLTKIIAEKEEELNPDFILAEIIHLPEARIGNVIRRSTLRKYEIPYLGQSVLAEENQIPIDDLYISLKNGSIILRSKKLNKEVRPYLTNAHNYFSNSLPVYHFLADFHSQNRRTGLYFNWGGLEQVYHFLPRVEYRNIILSKAQWKISEMDVSALELITKDKANFLKEIKNWRNKRKIPAWIQWVKSDNKITINLENYDLVMMFVDVVKNEKSIIIEEYLYNENDDFKREFIFPIFKVN
ncbi:lantibiotic dehydratase family protein [Chryseobacterium daeguense]|uniref:lantibiotic dehydratase family protein n=1 Tax=Chryseobacterium daeguense TaxID=412438 RepID=UPI000484BA8B|nr:lantibiotic dehydratase family protein [Chryseobacterium daeguense]